MEAETQAVSPSHTGVRRKRTALSRRYPATAKVMRLERGELHRAGEQDDYTCGERNNARQYRLAHLDRPQRYAQRIEKPALLRCG